MSGRPPMEGMSEVENALRSLVKDLTDEAMELQKEVKDLKAAQEELDSELALQIANRKYLEARLTLEKAGYRCTCGCRGEVRAA